MLRAKIFDGLGSLPRQIVRAFDEFILRWNINVKCVAVAYHIEYVLADHWRLADYTNVCGFGSQDESVHFMILLNHARVCGPGGEFHRHCCIQRSDGLGLLIVAPDEFVFGSSQELSRRVARLDDRFMANGAAADQGCRHRNPNHPCKTRYLQLSAPPQT